MDFVAFDAVHHQHHAAVIEQQLVAHAAIGDQFGVVDAHDAGGAGVLGVYTRQRERLAHLQLHQLVGEARDADLGALQIAHDGDEPALLGGDLAHQPGAFAVIVRAAMREVQAGHIQACADERFDAFGR
ncbi:hypothetical protein D3C72_1501070 [compost metagenome]